MPGATFINQYYPTSLEWIFQVYKGIFFEDLCNITFQRDVQSLKAFHRKGKEHAIYF